MLQNTEVQEILPSILDLKFSADIIQTEDLCTWEVCSPTPLR